MDSSADLNYYCEEIRLIQVVKADTTRQVIRAIKRFSIKHFCREPRDVLGGISGVQIVLRIGR